MPKKKTKPRAQPGPRLFKAGEIVIFENHVTGDHIARVRVLGRAGGHVLARPVGRRGAPLAFHPDGRATWTPHLSLRRPVKA